MIVEYRDGDRMLAIKATSIYRKAIEAAVTACDKVYVPTVELQTADAAAEAAEKWAGTSLDQMGVGEVRELTTPTDYTLALRTACSCYHTQLMKLAEKQGDLTVPPDETNEVMSRLMSLRDRLAGQTELAGTTATISFGEFTSEPMTTDDMANAARHMKRTK